MDEKAFQLLKWFSKDSTIQFDIYEKRSRPGLFLNREKLNSLAALLQHDLIVHNGQRNYTILKLGHKVAQYDSWKEYLEKELEDANLKASKDAYDLDISEYQSKYKFLPHVLSSVGLIISIISIIIATKSRKEVKSEESMSKPELISIIDSISISNQTKKVDSLHTAKTPIDSSKTK